MIIDQHMHLGPSLYGRTTTVDELLEVMDKMGVDMCVAAPSKPASYDLREANDYVAKAAEQHADRIIGLGRVDPWQGSFATAEVRRCYEMGLKGIHLNPWEENFQINRNIVFPVVEEAMMYGLPVVITGGYPHVSHPLQIGDLARRYPAVQFIMTNGGEFDLSGFTRTDAHTAMVNNPNLIMGTSGLCSHERLVNTVEQLGPERVMYESNYPMMDPRLEILRVTHAEVSDEAKALMLGGNAARVFGI
jgi:predicted TIM-barrel fold metal-dependent hydrolase